MKLNNYILNIKIFIYQKIANMYIIILQKFVNDKKKFNSIMNKALSFNEYCTDKNIYLN